MYKDELRRQIVELKKTAYGAAKAVKDLGLSELGNTTLRYHAKKIMEEMITEKGLAHIKHNFVGFMEWGGTIDCSQREVPEYEKLFRANNVCVKRQVIYEHTPDKNTKLEEELFGEANKTMNINQRRLHHQIVKFGKTADEAAEAVEDSGLTDVSFSSLKGCAEKILRESGRNVPENLFIKLISFGRVECPSKSMRNLEKLIRRYKVKVLKLISFSKEEEKQNEGIAKSD